MSLRGSTQLSGSCRTQSTAYARCDPAYVERVSLETGREIVPDRPGWRLAALR
jgi:hypothetical protein